jgi:hypothetical protein
MDDITGGDVNGATGGTMRDVMFGVMGGAMGDVQTERDYVSPTR